MTICGVKVTKSSVKVSISSGKVSISGVKVSISNVGPVAMMSYSMCSMKTEVTDSHGAGHCKVCAVLFSWLDFRI